MVRILIGLINHYTFLIILMIIINLGAWLLFLWDALMATVAPRFGLAMVVFNVINSWSNLVVFQVKVKGYPPRFNN